MTESAHEAGDCFIVAGRLALADPKLTLVHGRPLGQAGAPQGRRYWHAWVERRTEVDWPGLGPVEMVTVIDLSNGNEIKMSAGAYYNIGRIEETWRYNHDELEAMLDEHEHWGPWVDVEVD